MLVHPKIVEVGAKSLVHLLEEYFDALLLVHVGLQDLFKLNSTCFKVVMHLQEVLAAADWREVLAAFGHALGDVQV